MEYSRVCKECKLTKPIYKFTGNKKTCHLCYNEKKNNVLEVKNLKDRKCMLKSNYNLSLQEYDRMFKDQYGRCYICEKPQLDISKRLHVDHCHSSGEVRTLLCSKCNITLGLVNEDPEILLNMISYIKKFEFLKRND